MLMGSYDQKEVQFTWGCLPQNIFQEDLDITPNTTLQKDALMGTAFAPFP